MLAVIARQLRQLNCGVVMPHWILECSVCDAEFMHRYVADISSEKIRDNVRYRTKKRLASTASGFPSPLKSATEINSGLVPAGMF